MSEREGWKEKETKEHNGKEGRKTREKETDAGKHSSSEEGGREIRKNKYGGKCNAKELRRKEERGGRIQGKEDSRKTENNDLPFLQERMNGTKEKDKGMSLRKVSATLETEKEKEQGRGEKGWRTKK